MSFAIKFGNLSLDGFHEVDESHASRVVEHRFGRRPGSIAPRVPAPDSRPIILQGDVWEDSESELMTYLDGLRAALTDAGKDRLFLRDDDRYLNAVKRNYRQVLLASQAPTKHAQVTIEFLADDPYWYSTTQQSVEAITGADTGNTVPVTNSGGTRTPPVIEITRSAGTDRNDVMLVHTTTSAYLKWTGTLTVGTKIIFDCVNHRVLVGGASGLGQFSGNLFLQLEPGLNNFVYTGPGVVDVWISFYERWS